jgi:hypothetical protein
MLARVRVLQPTLIVKNIKDNDVYRLFYDIRAIIHHIVVTRVANDAIYINEKCLNPQTTMLSNKKSIGTVLSYHF